MILLRVLTSLKKYFYIRKELSTVKTHLSCFLFFFFLRKRDRNLQYFFFSVLMYASCDDQFTYILHLLHRSIKPHLIQHEKENIDNTYDKEILHLRHNLSDGKCKINYLYSILNSILRNNNKKY